MAKFIVKLALIAVVLVFGCSGGWVSYIRIFFLIILLLIVRLYQSGGLADEKPVASNDTEIHKLVAAVKSDVYKQLPSSANAALTPISYTTQVVAGTNYFVKVLFK